MSELSRRRWAGVLAILLLIHLRGGLSLPSIGGKVDKVTYVYEKDSGGIPGPVSSAINTLNHQQILASHFEVDTTNAKQVVPAQYAVALPAAKQEGLPSLVAESNGKVRRVVRSPTTKEDVLGAAK